MSDDQRTFVIIGASLAGAKAAEALRGEGFTGRVVLVGAEAERPYERPPLSKGYLAGKDPRDKAFVHDAGWYEEHSVELMLGRRATGVDPTSHTVTLDGADDLHYDKLLFATGSRVRTIDLPGCETEGIRYLRSIADSDALLARMREGIQVVVLGAGWIGLETAAAAREHGCPVSVVEMEPLPLQRVLGDEVGTIFRDLHVRHGVDLHLNTSVRDFGELGGKVTSVVLEDNTELPADLVVVGVGIRPATELAEAAGLEVENGIVTDSSLRTADPDIYACGDVAAFMHPSIGKRIRIEHWANALNGGKAAALSMLGREVVYDRVPYFFTDQYDLGMEYAGYVEPHGYDRVVFRGDPAGGEFIAFWVNGGRVLAGMNVNIWDVQEDIQKLIRAGWAGKPVDLDRLADAGAPMGELLG